MTPRDMTLLQRFDADGNGIHVEKYGQGFLITLDNEAGRVEYELGRDDAVYLAEKLLTGALTDIAVASAYLERLSVDAEGGHTHRWVLHDDFITCETTGCLHSRHGYDCAQVPCSCGKDAYDKESDRAVGRR